MFGRGPGRGGRGRGRFANGQRPVSEGNRISIADQLAQFQAGEDTGLETSAGKHRLRCDPVIFTSACRVCI